MRLGLDIGTHSIGWWLYGTSEGQITKVIDGGVRIFSDGRKPRTGASLAVDRRNARSLRRRRDRYLRRRAALMKKLTMAGLMPSDPVMAKELERLDPYLLRATALDRPLTLHQIGRAIFHLNQRRGFRSNRKTDVRNTEQGLIHQATARLDVAIQTSGARTLGEFLFRRQQDAIDDGRVPPVRARMTVAQRDNSEEARAGYDYYPDRRHLTDEFDKIWSAQAPHHPGVLTDDLRDSLFQLIFYQRPLKLPEPGRCQFLDERRLPKAHPLTARRVLYETVNALRVQAAGSPVRALTLSERDSVVQALDHRKHTKSLAGMKLSFNAIGRVIGLHPGEAFTLETENRDAIACDPVQACFSHPDRFGNRWNDMPVREQWTIVDKLRSEENHTSLLDWLIAEYLLDRDHAEAIAAAPIPEGYSRIGETATRKILDALVSDVRTYSEAVAVCGWHHSDQRTGEILGDLPYYGRILDRHVIPGTQDPDDDDIARYGRVTNPTVHVGLNQLRRVVNRIIAVYGKPDQIVVELARELKRSKEQKEGEQQRNRKARDAAIKRGDKLEQLDIANTGRNRMILRLWEELSHDVMRRRCPYSGETISPSMLFDGSCDIDHILPYSRTLDDSPANRTICLREANRSKRNQTPWEAWGGTDQWEAISSNLNNLPKSKQWRFAPDSMVRFEENQDFLDRALVDTQYLGRLARIYLDALYADREQHVWVVPGRLTEMLRRHWGLNSLLPDHNQGTDKSKNRADHRHHAIDAAVIGATDRGLLKKISDAARQLEESGAEGVARSTKPPWEGFRRDIDTRLRRIIVSHRADHGRIDPIERGEGRDSTAGKLHNDTAYGLTGQFRNDVPLVVNRKPLDELNPGRLEQIRDPYLQNLLKVATRGKTGKEFTEALFRFAGESRRYRGIRRVRLIEPVKVIKVRDGKGRAYKGYKPDSNHILDIWELPGGSWVPVALTTYEAHQSRHAPKPHPAARRVMRLHKKDTIALTHPKYGYMITTVAQLSVQRLDLAAHNEANADARSRDKTDPFSFVRVSASTLKRSGARRVHVDEIGRMRDPGPTGC